MNAWRTARDAVAMFADPKCPAHAASAALDTALADILNAAGGDAALLRTMLASARLRRGLRDLVRDGSS